MPTTIDYSSPHESTEPMPSSPSHHAQTSIPASQDNSSSGASPSPLPRVSVAEQAPKDFGFLLRPELYHDVNDTDIPQAFRSVPHKHGLSEAIPEMLASGHFRAAADTAATALKSNIDPTDHETIFSFLYVRLVCLTLLDYHFEAAQEAKCLQDMNGPYFRDPRSGVNIAPWELRLLAVRLQAVGLGDWRRGVINYYEMAREARWHFTRSATSDDKHLWAQRLEDLGLHVGHALVEMGDIDGAARHLRFLLAGEAKSDSSLQVKLALIYLRIGDLKATNQLLDVLNVDQPESPTKSATILRALCAMTNGQYDIAARLWKDLNASFKADSGVQTMLSQNLAVCLVYSGKISEARTLLRALTQNGNVPHGVTFNLATIFELTSENARSLKVALAQTMASHEATSLGWEKFNADFKL